MKNDSDKKVAIVIATYSQGKLLEKCISSLKNITSYKNYKIYLVDDSGTGNIGREIKKKFKFIHVITNKENLGCSKSYNAGMKEALKDYNPDYIVLLNDDLEFIDSEWLSKIIFYGEKDEKIGILGCRMIYPDRSMQWIAKKGRIYSFMKPGHFEKSEDILKAQRVKEIIGSCYIIKKRVIEEIGFWDEKFSPYYGEESDYSFRAAKKGFFFLYVGETEIIHNGASSIKNLFNEKVWFIKKRNAIRLEWLNYNLSNIIRHTFIHIGSLFLSKNPIKKLKLLVKAYRENIKNYKEIKQKRKERNSWRKI
jgi:GT2 family glycosyltransferase